MKNSIIIFKSSSSSSIEWTNKLRFLYENVD